MMKLIIILILWSVNQRDVFGWQHISIERKRSTMEKKTKIFLTNPIARLTKNRPEFQLQIDPSLRSTEIKSSSLISKLVNSASEPRSGNVIPLNRRQKRSLGKVASALCSSFRDCFSGLSRVGQLHGSITDHSALAPKSIFDADIGESSDGFLEFPGPFHRRDTPADPPPFLSHQGMFYSSDHDAQYPLPPPLPMVLDMVPEIQESADYMELYKWNRSN